MSRALIFGVLVFALGGCATTPADQQTGNACRSETLTIDADFERGAFAACRLTGAYSARLEIRPEPGTTNNSAWYAFRVRTDRPASVAINMRYKDGSHRYWPKTSVTGEDWTKVSAENIRVSKDGEKAVLSLATAGDPVFVAAQPLDTVDAVIARADSILSKAGFAAQQAGVSGDGRPIPAYLHAPPQAQRLIVIIARQHPPETTGGAAFEAFITRLSEDDDAAKTFRRQAAIFVAPIVNPDGFARGAWRGNAQGFDVNRDWGPFKTPEISALAKRILELTDDYAPAFFIDFHSTQHSVIYAAPEGAEPSAIADTFLRKLAEAAGADAPEVSRSHRSDRTTAKAWSLERLGVAGLTYEVGDDADLEKVAETARIAAEALMETMREQDMRK